MRRLLVPTLGPVAALDGHRVTPTDPPPARRDLRDLALELGACAGRAVGGGGDEAPL